MSAASETEAPPCAYFDTSALVKRYVSEVGTRTVQRWLRTHRVISSVLMRIEVVSALRRRHTERALSNVAFQRLLGRVDADNATWHLVMISDDILESAQRHVLQSSARTLDAIHIASALTLYEDGLRVPFLTADVRQATVARSVGLQVVTIPHRRSR